MIDYIKNFINKIYDTYDLGSDPSMDVVIYNDKAFFTAYYNTLEECSVKELGSKIAEKILLKGLSTPNIYGDWLNEKDLKELKNIEYDWKDDDICFDLELAKFWELCRVVCNQKDKFKDKAVHIHWTDGGLTYSKVLTSVEEFDKYVGECYEFDED